MDVSQYDYHLPKDLIAQTPREDRSSSRLMVVNRQTGGWLHSYFSQIDQFLRPGDLLVLNNSRVRPARLIGQKTETGAKVELLILKQLEEDLWEALVKPAKRIKVGTVITFGEGALQAIAQYPSDVDGGWVFALHHPYQEIEAVFEALGTMPLPPYIHQPLIEKERYQTVFAKEVGSAAAPTAGLHFTEPLLDHITKQGIDVTYLTLHVGLGTFRPVKVEQIEEHQMHHEYYALSPETAEKINQTKRAGGRVIAVGTTTVRTLESIAHQHQGEMIPAKGWSDLFIYPGFSFQVVDGLLTNFHLPRSTLLMLVSAFSSRERIMAAYQAAIREKYRFFSFGDAMLII